MLKAATAMGTPSLVPPKVKVVDTVMDRLAADSTERERDRRGAYQPVESNTSLMDNTSRLVARVKSGPRYESDQEVSLAYAVLY